MSHARNATESLVGAATGLGMGIAANYWVLPLWGFAPNVSQSVTMGLFFFGISFVNRFAVRTLFSRIG